MDQPRAEQRENRRDDKRKAKSPGDHEADRARKRGAITPAIGAAAELLGRIGKAIEEEGADQEEIVQHRVGGEDHVARARALRGEEQERGDQRRGADHDVAIDAQHANELGSIEQGRARYAERFMHEASRDQNAEHKPDCLRNHGGSRGASDPGVEPKHQHDGRGHIGDVDRDLDRERKPRTGLSDQPAEHDIIGERQRRRPDPDREIGPGGAGDALAAAHGVQQYRSERHLQDDEAAPDQRGDGEPPHQQGADFLHLARADRLGGEGQRAHAQEGEQPEQAVEDDGRYRHPAEQRRVAEPPDRNRRDDADQRRRQVRDHRGTCDGKDLRGRDLGCGTQVDSGRVIARAARRTSASAARPG